MSKKNLGTHSFFFFNSLFFYFYNSNNNSSNNNYTMFVITKDSNKPYNKSSVSKIIIIKSHWLEKKPPLIFPSVMEKL